ncbi:MAG: MATE family efflux transporter [Bacteroidales bacterium]|nr:MATE family efflux transporter [Bacteroidales bacterium]
MSHIQSSISYKAIWKIAYPIIIGNMAQSLLAFVDTAFLGHLGRIELGASMMAGIYYFTFSTLAWGFAMGIQIVIARRFGEKKFPCIGEVFEHGLLIGAAIALLLFGMLHFLTAPILSSIIESPSIYNAAMQFMDYRHFGILFVCFNFLYRALYIGLSNTKMITYSTILMVCINIIFAYLLIFGNFGFPKMGIGGAALASVFAEISAMIFFTFITIKTLPLKKYALFTWHKIRGALIKSLLSLSIPTMMQRLISFGIWFIFFALIEHLGELPIAISGIVRSVYMLLAIPVFAFGATANTLTSRMIGEKKERELGATLFKIMKLSFLCIIPILVVVLSIPEHIVSIYTPDTELAVAAIPTLYVICASMLLLAFAMIYFEAVSGTGNTKIALYLELGVLCVYTFYIMLLAVKLKAPIEWVWSSEYVYATLIGGFSLLYMKYGNWIKKKV